MSCCEGCRCHDAEPVDLNPDRYPEGFCPKPYNHSPHTHFDGAFRRKFDPWKDTGNPEYTQMEGMWKFCPGYRPRVGQPGRPQ